MKTKPVKFLVIALATVFSFPVLLTATEEGHHGGAAEAVHAPDTVAGIWHAIKDHEHELLETVKAGKLAEVHRFAFTIRDLSKALAEKSTDLPPDQLAKVESSVERIAEVASLLDQYGDAGDQANTEDQCVRLGKLLQFIETQYPEGVLSKGGEVHPYEAEAHHGEEQEKVE